MKVLNYGSLNIDHVYQVEQIVQPGQTIDSFGVNVYPGGKGMNQSVAIARAGCRVYHAGNIGPDGQELRRLLGLRQQRTDLQFEAARVTQRDVSNWASTVVLNRGSQHGVAVGDCAVDSTGNLAGVVTDVGLNWCCMATLADTEAQFGAMVFRTEETAVAGGDLALMSEGKLKLQYLSDSANLIKGDLVVTSGLGGYYPAGLVIGTVDEVRTDDGGLARYAVLTPRCDLSDLRDLYIITDFDVIE